MGGRGGAEAGEVLAVAGAVDVEADGGHGEAIEDGGGDGAVTIQGRKEPRRAGLKPRGPAQP